MFDACQEASYTSNFHRIPQTRRYKEVERVPRLLTLTDEMIEPLKLMDGDSLTKL